VLAQVPKGSAEMVAATIRTIFAQPSAAQVRDQLGVIAGMLGRQFPKVGSMLLDAAEDITAFAAFPLGHWKKIWSTNPLERLNKEIKRRTDVVGVFPNPRPCSAWPGLCSSRRTTNGRSASAPLPVRRIHGPARQATRRSEGGSHTGTAHGIVSITPLTDHTVKIIYASPRDVTSSTLRT
jgi:putative transposase